MAAIGVASLRLRADLVSDRRRPGSPSTPTSSTSGRSRRQGWPHPGGDLLSPSARSWPGSLPAHRRGTRRPGCRSPLVLSPASGTSAATTSSSGLREGAAHGKEVWLNSTRGCTGPMSRILAAARRSGPSMAFLRTSLRPDPGRRGPVPDRRASRSTLSDALDGGLEGRPRRSVRLSDGPSLGRMAPPMILLVFAHRLLADRLRPGDVDGPDCGSRTCSAPT